MNRVRQGKTDFLQTSETWPIHKGLIFGQDNRMLTSCTQVDEPTGIAETQWTVAATTCTFPPSYHCSISPFFPRSPEFPDKWHNRYHDNSEYFILFKINLRSMAELRVWPNAKRKKYQLQSNREETHHSAVYNAQSKSPVHIHLPRRTHWIN